PARSSSPPASRSDRRHCSDARSFPSSSLDRASILLLGVMMSFRFGSLALPLLALAACTSTATPPPPAAAGGNSAAALPQLTQAEFAEQLSQRTFQYF